MLCKPAIIFLQNNKNVKQLKQTLMTFKKKEFFPWQTDVLLIYSRNRSRSRDR
jgi:hypothetical protein